MTLVVRLIEIIEMNSVKMCRRLINLISLWSSKAHALASGTADITVGIAQHVFTGSVATAIRVREKWFASNDHRAELSHTVRIPRLNPADWTEKTCQWCHRMKSKNRATTAPYFCLEKLKAKFGQVVKLKINSNLDFYSARIGSLLW